MKNKLGQSFGSLRDAFLFFRRTQSMTFPKKLNISISHNICPNPVANGNMASLAKKGTHFSRNELCPPIHWLPMG